jgi:hypothetical protein
MTLCAASQRVFVVVVVVVVYFVINSVQKLFDTPSYVLSTNLIFTHTGGTVTKIPQYLTE